MFLNGMIILWQSLWYLAVACPKKLSFKYAYGLHPHVCLVIFQVQCPGLHFCCCFLGQEILLTLLQLTQAVSTGGVRQPWC